jgi:hypothetical protein
VILDFQRILSAGHIDPRAAVEKRCDRADIQRRRHHHEPQIVTGPPRLLGQRQAEIGVDAPLVKLVDDDGGDVGEQRILLQPRRENAFSGEKDARFCRELSFEPDVPAHLAAERPVALVGDAARDRPCRNAAWLKHQNPAVGRECRRHARRLSRSGGGGKDERAARAYGLENRGDVRVDRQGIH